MDAPGQTAEADKARRAASFGAVASAYATHRPDYPVAAIQWALEPALALAGRPAARPIEVTDLGAGTGKLTAQLASLTTGSRGVRVVAVEPDPDMLAELRRRLPGVTAVAGRAEAIPLPDACADAVLSGQAMHWFDLDRAMPEIARVLRPGGAVAGLWNADDDRVDWVAGVYRASGRHNVAAYSSFEEGPDTGLSGWISTAGRTLFWPAEHAGFEHAQVRTAQSLVETFRTHSMYLIMDPAAREAVLAGVRDYLAATPQTAAGEFRWPMYTLAVRAVRR
ncbi:MAG TPA: class I SAM-dependent methyltransferase [Streptosporangiaceae bacterium]|nr:class I SAM-dependent methyltransferase [Streptosporangiaceae bacterium]